MEASLLQLLKELGFDDWRTLREGYRRQLLSRAEIIAAATAKLSRSMASEPDLAMLASPSRSDAHELERVLDRLAAEEADVVEHVLADRLRLVVLLHLRQTHEPTQYLLERVAEVYAQFGYPRDMKGAVYFEQPNADAVGAKVGDQLGSPIESLDRVIAELKAALGVAQSSADEA